MDKGAIEKHNVETFKKYGIRNPGKFRYICTECGRDISINGSISRQGHKLMCMTCFHLKCWDDPEFSARYFKGE